MRNVVPLKKTALRPVALAYGRITRRAEDAADAWFVLTDDGRVREAQRADGCLLMPEIHDRVLLSEDGQDDCFILHVLVKGGQRSEVVIPGDGVITSGSGGLTLHADTVTVSAVANASLAAPEITCTAVTARANFISFSFLSEAMEAHIRKAAAVIDTLDKVCGRVMERIKTSFRRIEDFEEIKAGRISTIVRERFAVRARHASLRTEEEVAIDGKKIHLG